MEKKSHGSHVRKVLLSPKLEGKAGRAHLSGILGYLDAGHVWDVRILRSSAELTAGMVRRSVAEGVDGFLVSIASPARQKATIDALAASGRPVVVLDDHRSGKRAPDNFAFVRFDTAAIVAAALDRFAEIMPGAAVAFVPSASDEPWSAARKEAFASLAGGRRLAFSVFRRRGGRSLGEWLASLPDPCGVLAANDVAALETVEACTEAGIGVPDQIAVLGIDNDELICGHARPPIATVEPNFAGAGFLAADTLQRMMDGRPAPRETTVAESVSRIVARESARPSRGVPALVARAMDAIRAHAASLDVRSLASALGVSRTRLCAEFARRGLAVAAEIRERRFEMALKMLSDPSAAIGPIANLCGWKSETHLMHFFKRRTGMTMREWRRRHLSGRGNMVEY